jgi:hypothetical protein
MIRAHWSSTLNERGACSEAVTWAKGYKTPAGAWRACKRADWMLWIAGRLAGPFGADTRKPLVLAACACARTALKFVPEGELRPLKAIETAEAWCAGKANLDEVRIASAAAYAAAYAAASYAAYAAAYAAYAAAYAAAYSYAAAADAAAYAYAAAVRMKALADMAPLVRKHLKCPRLPR